MSLTKIQQSQMSGSLAFDADMVLNSADYLQKPDRTLVDDLNALRTQIKNIQGTSAWTDGLEGTQDLADIHTAMQVSGADAHFQGELKVTNDALVSGSLEVAGAVEFLDNLKVGGDLQIMGNDLSGSAGGNMRFESAGKVVIAGDLRVDGNHIVASDNTMAITLSGSDVEVAGAFKVSGDEIQDSLGHAVMTFDAAGGNAEVDADLSVTGEMTVDTGVVNLTDGVMFDSSLVVGQLDISADLVKLSDDLQVMGNDISGSAGLNISLLSGGDVRVAGDMTVGGNEIKSWDAGTEVATVAITLSGDDVEVEGDLTVGGNKILMANGSTIDNLAAGVLLLDEDLVEVSGDLQVSGDVIKSSTGNTAITLNDESVTVAHNLTVSGDLVVNGAVTTVNTTNLEVRDAIVGFGYVSGSTELNDSVGDRGFVFSRIGQDNVSAHWSESADEFRFVLTANDADVTNITESGWVSIHANNMIAEGDVTVEGGDIYGADGLNITLASAGRVSVAGEFEVAGDHISGSSGLNLSLLSGGDVRVAGDMIVGGNDIKSWNSGTEVATVAITLSGDDVAVKGDLTVEGNTISSSTAEALELSGDDVEVKGELQVSGNAIKSSSGDTVFTLAGASATVEGNLVVDGDFVVNGAMTIVNTNNLVVKDTIVGLGYVSGANGPTEVTPAGDRGFVFSRPSLDNVATFWDHDSSKFKMVFTDSEPGTEGGINELSYANFHAGIVYSQAGFSGSLTKLVDGADYMVAGVGITISTGSNGAITISGASNSYNKGYLAGNSAHINAGTGVVDFAAAGFGTLSSGANLDKNIDVYLNGALLAYGEGRDVTGFTTTSVTLNATLAASLIPDDVITVVLRSLA